MKVHTIKEGEPSFGDVLAGKKQFSIQPNSTEYQVGDLLMICQYVNDNFTGRDVEKRISYIMKSGEGLKDGYVLLGLEDVEHNVDSSSVEMKVLREGYDFLSRTMFGDCPHCGKHISKEKSPDRCNECGSPVRWSENKFGSL